MNTRLQNGTTFTAQDALDHSWKWFELHASQRMQLINYFFIAVAFLSAAYATGLEADEPLVSAGVAALGIVMSIGFQLIELRTRELIEVGERALASIESTIQSDISLPTIAFVNQIEKPARPFTSYSFVIRMLHLSTLVGFALGTAYALRMAL
jgi:hypothetical protein